MRDGTPACSMLLLSRLSSVLVRDDMSAVSSPLGRCAARAFCMGILYQDIHTSQRRASHVRMGVLREWRVACQLPSHRTPGRLFSAPHRSPRALKGDTSAGLVAATPSSDPCCGAGVCRDGPRVPSRSAQYPPHRPIAPVHRQDVPVMPRALSAAATSCTLHPS